MNLRNELLNFIDNGNDNDWVMLLLSESGYKIEDVMEHFRDYYEGEDKEVLTEDELKEKYLNQLRAKIKSNNVFYGDINKHDIISRMGHFERSDVKIRNENYELKKYIEELEHIKGNLQIKLELCRHCSKCVYCEDISCINNIWYKSNK